MVTDVTIHAIQSLPEGVGGLRAESLAEGHDFVDRLVIGWEDGSNRFDRSGEVLLEVRRGSDLVGVGGLNVDPYSDEAGLGRIRHVYLSPSVRGTGVGQSLVMELVDHAGKTFSRLRLRVAVPGAEGFYDRLGFRRTVDEPNATHDLLL